MNAMTRRAPSHSPLPRWREVRVASRLVRYQVAGAGDPVVLVHGLSGSTYWWLRNLAYLAAHHKVYLVDLPGFGAMRQHRESFVLARAAHWLRDWMSAVGIERAHVVGHSMGGLISIRLAASYPEVVRRLVLAAPAGIPMATNLLGHVVPLIRAVSGTTPVFWPLLAYDAMRAGPLTLLRATDALLRENVHEDLARIAAPTLLVWGERDTLVPPFLGPLMRDAIPHSRLVVIPNAGHVVMFDRPRAFNYEVRAFLTSMAPA